MMCAMPGAEILVTLKTIGPNSVGEATLKLEATSYTFF